MKPIVFDVSFLLLLSMDSVKAQNELTLATHDGNKLVMKLSHNSLMIFC